MISDQVKKEYTSETYSTEQPGIVSEFLFSLVGSSELDEQALEGFISWCEYRIGSCFIQDRVQATLFQVLSHCMKSVGPQDIRQLIEAC